MQPALHQIAALKDTHNLASLMGVLEAEGSAAPLFRFGVQQDEKDSSKQIAGIGQAGLSLPDRDYYLVDNPHFQAIRKEYVAHVTKMFTLAGDSPAKAAREAGAVMTIETALAKASISRTALRNPENRYHIYSLAQLQQLAPDFDFSIYFTDVRSVPLTPSTSPRPISSKASTRCSPLSPSPPGSPTSAGI